MSISVCIPSRGPAIGLWATIASLQAAGLSDFHVALSTPKIEPHVVMESYGVNIYSFAEPMIPPTARNLAASYATGDYLLFVDDHCIIPTELIKWIPILDKDVLHFPYRPQAGVNAPTYYHFTGIKSMVEGDYVKEPLIRTPYRCASANHGCFAVRRVAWEKMGGYPCWYSGFGGEEASFDLSAWANGCEVWIDPRIPYYHYSARADQRGYEKVIEPANYEKALYYLAPHLDRLKARFDAAEIPC